MIQPRRVLLVSATIGEGHNATARAVAEAVRDRWPGCEVSWVDALQVMGSWVPRTFGAIYVANVESTPWLYDFFYALLWRQRWFADACRRFVGTWAGWGLRPVLAAQRPDLVVSTYPMGTAGLDRLRKRGLLDAPIAAVISDFAPHPFWVYSAVDVHYAMSRPSVRAAERAMPEARTELSAPPVVRAFHPREKAAARRECGLPEDGFTVLISCGSLGFGSVERAVDGCLRAEVDRVVVVCGRNEALRRRLAARAEPRLDPLGWVEDMPARTAAADVVLTNAGGATALEAMACARPVLMFEPIAGHGRPNAELMAEAGLAEVCANTEQLAAALHRLATETGALAAAERRMRRHLDEAGDFADQVAGLARLRAPIRPEPMRAQDAFFFHATTPEVPQHTGAVLTLAAPQRPISGWIAELRERIAERAPGLPMVSKRLATPRHREPHWIPVRRIDPHEHLRELAISTEAEREPLEKDFFAAPVPADRPPWELAVVHRPGAPEISLLVKMHHSLGDGLVMTSTLLHLLADDDPGLPEPSAPPVPRLHQAAAVLRGVLDLAAAGSAPRTGLGGTSTTDRRYAWRELPAAEVEQTAHALGVTRSAVLLGVVAEALHRLDENNTIQRDLRAMVPRRARPGTEDFGNHAAAVSLDLPIGPMSPRVRIAEVGTRLGRAQRRGQPQAAEAVMRALSALPPRWHARACRAMYRRRFFQAIVSVMPGHPDPTFICGAHLRRVHPVLPLADGVALGIGTLRWEDEIGIGLTADAGLLPDVDKLADRLPEAFAALRTGERS